MQVANADEVVPSNEAPHKIGCSDSFWIGRKQGCGITHGLSLTSVIVGTLPLYMYIIIYIHIYIYTYIYIHTYIHIYRGISLWEALFRCITDSRLPFQRPDSGLQEQSRVLGAAVPKSQAGRRRRRRSETRRMARRFEARPQPSRGLRLRLGDVAGVVKTVLGSHFG